MRVIALLLLFAAPVFGQSCTMSGYPVLCDPPSNGGPFVMLGQENLTHIYPARPDARLTPGAIRTTDATEICGKSFRTKKYRHTTQRMKLQVCAAYHITAKCPDAKHMEIDHLVPLELGGSDEITNLWPQPKEPLPGFKQKDKLENWEKRAVCRGEISLPQAQIELSGNWYEAYVRHGFGVAK